MHWREAISGYAARRGRQSHDSPLGLGIEFADGCAAFWMLPGEVMSSVPIPAEGPVDVDALIQQYETLDHRRERVLHVLRHFFAEKKFKVDRARSGEWAYELAGGSSTAIEVGDRLTLFASQHESIPDLVRALMKDGYFGGKPPSPKRIDRYLAAPGSPIGERSWVDDDSRDEQHEDDDEDGTPQTIAGAAAELLRCHGVNAGLNAMARGVFGDAAVEQAKDAVTKPTGAHGRLNATLLRLAEHLPEATAWVETFQGKLGVAFDDRFGAFDVPVNDRGLARRIKQEGPEAVGDALAAAYRARNDQRRRVFAAIFRVAAARGWKMHHASGMSLLGVPEAVSLGVTTWVVQFEPDQNLNRLLDAGDETSALRDLFAGAPDFADAVVAALDDVTADELPVRPPEAELVDPVPDGGANLLLDLNADRVARLDEYAQAKVRLVLNDPKMLYKYLDPDYYDRGRDTWATAEDWAKLAERGLASAEYVDGLSVLILLDAGRPGADEQVRRWFAQSEAHHEVDDSEIELAWTYRHTDAAKAREWFAPQEYDSVPYAEVRARLGDPVARRRVATSAQRTNDDERRDPAQLSSSEQAALHRKLLDWARNNTRFSPPSANELRQACAMGWRDVAEAMASNPHLLPGLLTIKRRTDQFDEPGALLAGDFFLAWSRLDPSPFLARVIATTYETDLVELASQAARASVERNPAVRKALPMSLSTYVAWRTQLDDALAIAWLRCRSAM